MIGLCGAHRTGKTTLAQAFAEKVQIPFVRTSATEVFHALGKDPRANYHIHERIAIQEAILVAFEALYARAQEESGIFISDRTPIDMASYLLADVQRTTFEGEVGVANLVNDYVSRCLAANHKWFSVVILVQPGIPLVEEAGKAQACPAYIEHLNALQLGLLTNPEEGPRNYVIPRRFLTLEERLGCVTNAFKRVGEHHLALRETRKAAGILLH